MPQFVIKYLFIDEIDTNLDPPTKPPMTPKTIKRICNAFNFPSGDKLNQRLSKFFKGLIAEYLI